MCSDRNFPLGRICARARSILSVMKFGAWTCSRCWSHRHVHSPGIALISRLTTPLLRLPAERGRSERAWGAGQNRRVGKPLISAQRSFGSEEIRSDVGCSSVEPDVSCAYALSKIPARAGGSPIVHLFLSAGAVYIWRHFSSVPHITYEEP